MPTAPAMPTVGEIAQLHRVPVHRIEYLIRARRIEPCGWAGNARVFDQKTIDYIAEELQRMSTPGRRKATASVDSKGISANCKGE
ncbi:MAG: hypothetical protein ACJ8C4_18395 [Gemmataceae bacterium]